MMCDGGGDRYLLRQAVVGNNNNSKCIKGITPVLRSWPSVLE